MSGRRSNAAQGRSILVAEDSRVIQRKILEILEQLDGTRVRVASDGLEALALVRESKPDLLVSDNEMPGMNGIQLIRVLRTTWSRFELPILMLTANSEMETKVMALSNGANDYVTKPVEAAELCARVLGQLELSAAVNDNLTARVQLLEARKYQAVGRLAAGVAHELNNPAQYATTNLSFLLRSIASMRATIDRSLSWARQNPQHPFAAELQKHARETGLAGLLTDAPEAAAEALEGIRRMAGIVAELREFAGDPGEGSGVNVNRAIENTVAVSRASWKPHVDVELSLADGLPTVRGAPQSVKQAVLNLLTNAVEAQTRPRDGAGKRGRVRIRTRAADGGVLLEVSDDGPGIDPRHESRIFDPFFSTKAHGKGSGQGLFVAYSIIAGQCHGTLRCESPASGGATFVVWLPAED